MGECVKGSLTCGQPVIAIFMYIASYFQPWETLSHWKKVLGGLQKEATQGHFL